MKQQLLRGVSLVGFLSLMIILGTVAWQGGTPDETSRSDGETGSRVKIEGETRNIAAGDILKQLTRKEDGTCSEAPPYQVGLTGNTKSVEVYFDGDNCTLTVSAIETSASSSLESAPTPAPTPMVQAVGRVKYASPLQYNSSFEVRAQAVIRGVLWVEVLTGVRTSVKFYNDNNGGSVFLGHNPWHDCQVYSPTGWENVSCVHDSYSLSGPDEIYSQASGEFYNDQVLDDYTTESWARAKGIGYEYGDDRFDAECGISRHPAWTWARCELWKDEL